MFNPQTAILQILLVCLVIGTPVLLRSLPDDPRRRFLNDRMPAVNRSGVLERHTRWLRRYGLPTVAVGFLLTGLLIPVEHRMPGGVSRSIPGFVFQTAEHGPDTTKETSTRLPASYEGRSNPLPDTKKQRRLGRRRYETHCRTCHGPDAAGDGPVADALSPPPKNLVSDVLPVRSDAYLFWRISTGKPGTAMPSFQHVLAPAHRWQIILYLRHRSRTTDR